MEAQRNPGSRAMSNSNLAGEAPEHWSSRLTFLMASVGFAVGLGNIWRFPYVAGENGGSAFVLLYLLFAFGIGVPLVMSEWAIGRRGRSTASASGSIADVANQAGAGAAWGNVGAIAVLAVFMLMLFYTTVAGWTMDYFARGIAGGFNRITAEESRAMFAELTANPLRLAFWHTVVCVATVYINSRGLHAGIERAVKVLMPALFGCMIVMVGYAATVGDLGAAAGFLLAPDFSRLTGGAVLTALGQAFFSIGIAMAVMITYGSHLGRRISIPRNAFIVVGADSLVALLAGFAVFPIVFAHGLPLNSGEGLVFQTLPIAFGELLGGRLFGSVFFLLLIAAAVTSCIGNFAPVVAWTKHRFNISHTAAAAAAGAAMWVFGLGSVFSFNLLAEFRPLSFIGILGDKTIYECLDYIMSNMLLPAGAFLTSIFVGWVADRSGMREEFGLPNGLSFRVWLALVRYVVPIAVAAIFIAGIRG